MAQDTITATRDEWLPIGKRVRERREASPRRWTLKDAANVSTVSDSVWSNLERAAQESFARVSLERIAVALGWTDDAIERMLTGAEPEETDDAAFRTEPALRTVLDERLSSLEQAVAELVHVNTEMLRAFREAGLMPAELPAESPS